MCFAKYVQAINSYIPEFVQSFNFRHFLFALNYVIHLLVLSVDIQVYS